VTAEQESTEEDVVAFFCFEAGATETLVGEQVDVGGVLDFTDLQLEQSLAEW
jgi:hypothetical protein